MTHQTNNTRGPAVMVVHGPEVFDHGEIGRLLELTCPERVIVAGVMARTAAEESGLCVEFDGRPPSRVISEIDEPVFLLNHGKTPHSGRVFGDIVASRLLPRGLVHVECSSGTVYRWNGGDQMLASDLASSLGFSVEDSAGRVGREDRVRHIRGCIPGEPVYVNGIIIGRATAETVVLKSEGGGIVPVSGVEIKRHGIDKLQAGTPPDIGTAWCKSGTIRSAAASGGTRAVRDGKVAVIDHCGHEMYARLGPNCCGVLAIGDDTTAVCGHICLHRGIPVLGITDGDRDAILPSAFAPGSLVIDTRPERDDDIGKEVAGMVPENMVCWEDWTESVLDRIRGRFTIVLDLREASR